MSRSGLTQRIVDLANAIVGHIRGGLAYVTVLGNAMMAGISGSASADCAATGSILIPALVRQGYKPQFAALIAAFSSLMAPILPPSIFLLLSGSMAGEIGSASGRERAWPYVSFPGGAVSCKKKTT